LAEVYHQGKGDNRLNRDLLIKIGEIACVVLLAVFIMFISSSDDISDKTAKQVTTAVVKVYDTEGLVSVGKKQIKKQLKLDSNNFDGCYYYASESIMDVREVLVIKLKDVSDADAVLSVLESRVSEKTALFEDYAPEESALLKSHVLISEGGFIYYAVGENADEGLDAFKSSL
jgi:hypothetical protein